MERCVRPARCLRRSRMLRLTRWFCDSQVCYNLAAVLEATGELDEALIAYERSLKLGIARAEINVRNVSTPSYIVVLSLLTT